MASIHEVGVGADTKPFEQGIRSGVIDPVQDATKAFGNLQDAAGDAGTDGARSLGKLEDQLRDVQRQSEKVNQSVDDFKVSSKDSFEGSSENVRGFKEEAVANFSEVASSFNGDITQMADGVQGLTGGLAGSLTPGIGIPVAIIGAIAGAFLQSWITSTQDSKQQVSDMYDDMLESGKNFLTQQFIQDHISEIVKDEGKYAEAVKRSTALNVDKQLVLRAMAGDQEAVNTLVDTEKSKHDAATAAIKASNQSLEDKQTAIDAENAKWSTNVGWLVDVQRNTDSAASKAQVAHDAIAGIGTAGEQAGEKVRQGYAKIPSEVHTKVVVDDSSVARSVARARAALAQTLTIEARVALNSNGERRIL